MSTLGNVLVTVKRPVMLVLSAALVGALGTVAMARDESGALDLIRAQKPSFFLTRSAPQPQPVVETLVEGLTAAAEAPRRRVSVRFSPPAEGTPVTVSHVPVVETDPVTALMNDETLRRGDVVMFPDGARVFVGKSRKLPWSEADFESVSDSKAMANRGRAEILALTSNPGQVEPTMRTNDVALAGAQEVSLR